MTVVVYFIELKKLWNELAKPLTVCGCGSFKLSTDRENEDRVMQFL